MIVDYRSYGSASKVSFMPPVRKNRNRSATVLMCVLVVLIIVGLLTSQTMQTLLVVRRGDAVRHQLRQAREVLELGKIILQRNGRQTLEPELRVSLDSEQAAWASISIVEDRIIVRSPVGTDREVTVSETVGD